eukprot:Trichotokara_eunicae@DN1197_c0_g1_i1.p1
MPSNIETVASEFNAWDYSAVAAFLKPRGPEFDDAVREVKLSELSGESLLKMSKEELAVAFKVPKRQRENSKVLTLLCGMKEAMAAEKSSVPAKKGKRKSERASDGPKNDENTSQSQDQIDQENKKPSKKMSKKTGEPVDKEIQKPQKKVSKKEEPVGHENQKTQKSKKAEAPVIVDVKPSTKVRREK